MARGKVDLQLLFCDIFFEIVEGLSMIPPVRDRIYVSQKTHRAQLERCISALHKQCALIDEMFRKIALRHYGYNYDKPAFVLIFDTQPIDLPKNLHH